MSEPFPENEPLFPEADIVFAKFWARFGAMLIDGLVVIAIVLPATYFNVIQWKSPWIYIVTSLLTIIYKPFMEYEYGATLGKMAVGIKVVGHQFQKVTLDRPGQARLARSARKSRSSSSTCCPTGAISTG